MNVSCPPHLITSLRNFSVRKLNIQNPIHSFPQQANFLWHLFNFFFFLMFSANGKWGEDARKTNLLKFQNSSVLRDVTLFFFSSPMNIIQKVPNKYLLRKVGLSSSMLPHLAGSLGHCFPLNAKSKFGFTMSGPWFLFSWTEAGCHSTKSLVENVWGLGKQGKCANA